MLDGAPAFASRRWNSGWNSRDGVHSSQFQLYVPPDRLSRARTGLSGHLRAASPPKKEDSCRILFSRETLFSQETIFSGGSSSKERSSSHEGGSSSQETTSSHERSLHRSSSSSRGAPS